MTNTNKPTPEPSDNLRANSLDPNTVPMEQEPADSKKELTSDKSKATGGTGTIRVTG